MLVPLLEKLGHRWLVSRGIRSRTASTSVGDLHFYDAPGQGSLPPAVILHGLCSNATAFGQVIQALRPHVRRVLAPDAPGHGLSGTPADGLTIANLGLGMAELLDREIDEPAIVCGNSLGGAVALRYALARPEKVRGLVLCSPGGAQMTPQELSDVLALFELRSRADAHEFLRRLHGRRPWYAPLIARDLMDHFARPAFQALRETARDAPLFTSEELAPLTLPIHVIWGRGDKLLPASNLEFFRRSLPAHAVVEEVYDAGHCPHLDAPRAVVRRIVAMAQRGL
jgi:pimeloyl-ACP methyl ester carboxylesterase